jgi:hypothetical protein
MKKLVVTPLTNTIWWATVDDKKGMITGNKEDVTDNAIDAVFEHLINMDGFSEKGFAGYEIPKKNSDETVTIAAFSNDTHVCVSKKLYEELLEYKAMYEDLCK